MQLFELQQKMHSKTLPKFMIFVGPEYKIKNLYIDQIAKITETTVTHIDDCSSILALGKVSSLLGKNCLYVCRYDKSFTSQQKYWSTVTSKLGNNYLILILEDVDKRGKFYSTFKTNSIFEFNKQPFDTVMLMLKNCGLPKPMLEYLVKGCDCEYSRITQELDKIVSYGRANKCTMEQSFNQLIQDVLCINRESTIEQLQEQLLNRNPKALVTVKELKQQQESTVKIVGYLYNAFRQQLIVQSHYATPQSTGLPQFIITACSKRNGVYSTEKLIKNIKLLKDVEQGIKNGLYEEQFGLDYLVTNIL